MTIYVSSEINCNCTIYIPLYVRVLKKMSYVSELSKVEFRKKLPKKYVLRSPFMRFLTKMSPVKLMRYFDICPEESNHEISHTNVLIETYEFL